MEYNNNCCGAGKREVDFRFEFLKAKAIEFIHKNDCNSYSNYAGRLVGDSKEKTIAYIDFLDKMMAEYDIEPPEITQFILGRFYYSKPIPKKEVNFK